MEHTCCGALRVKFTRRCCRRIYFEPASVRPSGVAGSPLPPPPLRCRRRRLRPWNYSSSSSSTPPHNLIQSKRMPIRRRMKTPNTCVVQLRSTFTKADSGDGLFTTTSTTIHHIHHSAIFHAIFPFQMNFFTNQFSNFQLI